MKNILFSLFVIVSLSALSRDFSETEKSVSTFYNQTHRINSEELKLNFPVVMIENLNQNIQAKITPANHPKLVANNYKINAIVNGKDVILNFNENGIASFEVNLKKGQNFNFLLDDFTFSSKLSVTPIGWVLVPGAILLLIIAYSILHKVRLNIKKKSAKKLVNDIQSSVSIDNNEVKSTEKAFI